MPPDVRTRAKYIILDGVACALIAAHLPWSEVAAKAVFEMEGRGECSVFGWDKVQNPCSAPQGVRSLKHGANKRKRQQVSAPAAALLNGTFIQGFELDDVSSIAPLHSSCAILPAIFAAAEHVKTIKPDEIAVGGSAFLLAAIVGFEVGPRVGLSLHGLDIVSRGWHSGAVFGPAAAAAAVSKILAMHPSLVEDALGIACTQACGLMSAQYESMVKRMQCAFGARNGLFAALLARGGYTGIQQVFERPYGGFLSTFGHGSDKKPSKGQLVRGLGEEWQLCAINIKAHAAMMMTHGPIECISRMQLTHPDLLKDHASISRIVVELSEVAFAHGGWKAPTGPLTSTGAQMNIGYVVAAQILDGQVLASQFSEDKLNSANLRMLMEKVDCVHNSSFDDYGKWRACVTVHLDSPMMSITETLQTPKGINPALTNDEIYDKWKSLTTDILDSRKRREIENLVLHLEDVEDISTLCSLLRQTVGNPLRVVQPAN